MTTVALTVERLKRRALSLGAVKTFDYAMQFLLPVVLVRCLDATTFGEYRLLWLAVGTVMALAPLNIPQSLYFFLPRSPSRVKRIYILNTLAFLTVMGGIAAWAVSPWDPWLPAAILPLERYGGLVPGFVLLYVMTYTLDFLPTVEERIRLQAFVTVGLSALRVVLLSFAAYHTGELVSMLWVLIGISAVKLVLLLGYTAWFHGLARPWLDRKLFSTHFTHAAPIGVSIGLFSMRQQVDQWVAAYLFAIGSFAAFSIAAVLSPIVNLFRNSVNEAFLPSMSRMQAAGDVRSVLEMNSRANCMVSTLLYPLLAFAFVFADEIVSVIYTTNYLEAVPVMRVYIVGLAAMVIEIGSLTLLMREGQFAMRVNLAVLAIAALTSFLGATHFGLPGAAAGSVLAVYLDRTAMMWRMSQRSGIPFRKVQDWRGLAVALAYSVLAAAFTWGIVDLYLTQAKPLVRLAAGAALLAAAYAALPMLVGMRRLRPAP